MIWSRDSSWAVGSSAVEGHFEVPAGPPAAPALVAAATVDLVSRDPEVVVIAVASCVGPNC